ncbi:MAG: type II toxin-antitoxin system RelE/ParE family toxin, partial [Clostridia bacterium]|nr:type II toxin-antitoxin system RelE/ParE family toxin [Clostridia bacterium]
MKWNVLMTDTAKSDLREIALYLYDQSGDAEIAASFVTELQEQCLALESFPERGAIPKDYVLKALGYRYLAYKHYLVFYMTDAKAQSVS